MDSEALGGDKEGGVRGPGERGGGRELEQEVRDLVLDILGFADLTPPYA